VRREPVTVERWVRGEESGELTAPAPQSIKLTALGGSVATPPEGIAAEVVEVASYDELHALGERARGKAVLFNRPMQRTADFKGYGDAVPMRGGGPSEAARAGAVLSLIRSVGTAPGRLPHTGALHYAKDAPRIPAAAISSEDADLIHRLLAGGKTVRVRIKLGAHVDGKVESANVVGEVPGREPGEVVVIGAHLDSWDLGTGAIDDGAGVAIAIEAARLVAALGRPRRTLRVVLFMNEENGLDGARAYADKNRAQLPRHFAALEADAGAGRPTGALVVGEAGRDRVKALAAALAPLRADTVTTPPIGGADLIPLQAAGVPIVGVSQDVSGYFDWHHTAADTADKIDPRDFAEAVAAFAVLARELCELPAKLPAPPAPPHF
jgi:Zn-dependent M28 family amino/carboxypeptidase